MDPKCPNNVRTVNKLLLGEHISLNPNISTLKYYGTPRPDSMYTTMFLFENFWFEVLIVYISRIDHLHFRKLMLWRCQQKRQIKLRGLKRVPKKRCQRRGVKWRGFPIHSYSHTLVFNPIPFLFLFLLLFPFRFLFPFLFLFLSPCSCSYFYSYSSSYSSSFSDSCSYSWSRRNHERFSQYWQIGFVEH